MRNRSWSVVPGFHHLRVWGDSGEERRPGFPPPVAGAGWGLAVSLNQVETGEGAGPLPVGPSPVAIPPRSTAWEGPDEELTSR